ncbi:expressed unknown protein [Seminavis robusta]|uniref:Uncharacterized protein n=1 Tax=Seminavis robusta TaxID=568900 RepID=A0A9N8H4A8_9STRA|nr:expressed unknown protein [Seminavis robusta]|eukprot:Sro45_g026830.1 n/a (429) ;mRNA; f:16250-17536
MHRHVAGKQKQYVCITNTPPYVRATDEGDEWVVNHCWIQAMRASLSLEATMEFMADRLALVLGDQMVATVSHGVDCQCNDWMPLRPQAQETTTNPTNTLTWQRLEQHIPPEAQVTAEDWSVGDVVFYKHAGGNPNDKTGYVPPGWLKATILSTSQQEDDDNLLQLQVHYQDIPQWRVTARRDTLMNDWYMGQAWMLPDGYEKATVQLAQKYFKYMDYSIKPHQCVRTNEGKEAIILDWREFDWEGYMHKSSTKENLQRPPFGAHVPVQWVVTTNDNYNNDNNNTQQTLLPVEWIQDHTAAAPFPLEQFPTEPDQQQHWVRKALLQSIQSSGKQICHAATKLGKPDDIDDIDDSVMMIAYWPQDGEWYEAEPLDPETVSLQILASHAQFTLTGRYCPVAYEDGEFALTPIHYVRKTKRRQRSKHCPCLH